MRTLAASVRRFRLLRDWLIFFLPLEAVDLRPDKMCAIALAKDFKNNAATKHIDVAYNILSNYSATVWGALSHVPTTVVVANGMTKPLVREKLTANDEMYGMAEMGSN